MSLNPDPWLAERLLRRWCSEGKAMEVVVIKGRRAAHVYTQLPGTQVQLPVSVQVADLLERYLDPTGAVRLYAGESAEDLIDALAKRLYGDGQACGTWAQQRQSLQGVGRDGCDPKRAVPTK
jgi:hypothetical protein